MDRYEKALALWRQKNIQTDAALEAWDERQALAPMEAFLRAQTVKTWEKQIARSERGAERR